jgi:phosphoribosylformylglycinamidine synthase subunit PurS
VNDYSIQIRITPRRGILDPQGKAVDGALRTLGFDGVRDVHVGRLIVLTLPAASEDEARERAEEMCRKLLANPVTEDYEIGVQAPAGSAA